jgi:Tfp pilus assembly protein PilN
MRAVNLLPKDAPRASKKMNPITLAGIGAGALVFGLLAIALILELNSVSSKRNTLDTLRASLATKQIASVKPNPASQFSTEKSQRIAVLATALTGRIAWDRVLTHIGQVLPENVWLSTLTAKSPTSPTSPAPLASTTAAPSGLILQGYTYTQEDVARTLARLELVPDITDVGLQSSQTTKLGIRDVIQFTVVANIAAPGEAA